MHQRRDDGDEPMEPEPETYWIHVVPRKHTAETITLLIALAAWFVLLFLLLGHPTPLHHAGVAVPPHASEKR